MNIKSVTLTNGGFKGLVAEYTLPSERIGKSKFKVLKENLPHPIHLGLEVPFKDLRYHLLRICDIIGTHMDKGEVDSLMEQCEVIGIAVEADHFVIKGTKEVFLGKSFKITTPKVEEGDSYEFYEAVTAIIMKIIEETKLYLKGDVKVTDDELVIRYIGSMKEVDKNKDGYDEMSDEEKKKYHSDILEKVFGAVVMMPEDVEVNGIDEEESYEIEPQAEVISLPAKKK